MNPLAIRLAKDYLFKGLLVGCTLLLLLPLVLILFYIVRNGLAVINWDFLTSLPKPPGEVGAGISNAIVGTGILIGLAALISIPIGITTGVCLVEFKGTRLVTLTRICLEILQGIPSIVIGIIAYLWIVAPMGGFSALSGGFALGIMMLPMVIRSTEETLLLIPNTLKEASLSLGVPYYRTMIKVIVPTGLNGISTGILLGVARVAGETAPLLFTAFGNPFMSVDVTKPVNALPLLIFNFATSPYEDWQAMAWGASLVLVVFVLGLSLFTRMLIRR
ncbi:phosphate ABC transporter permease PstA [bacterium]|nr:phosphate ABC transporter permease PstA [bacterium]